MDARFDQYFSTLAILVAIFIVAGGSTAWAPLWLQWAWKGIAVAAAYYKGLHTDKPEKIAAA